MDGGADGVVGWLRGTDRQMASSEPGGFQGDPRATLVQKHPPAPSLTWRRKSLCRRLRLGGSGSCLQSRSGERVPLGPNTLRSLKHSVSIIWGGSGHCGGRHKQPRSRVEPPTHAPYPRYLILPGDGDAAGGKLGVEIIVGLVQVDALHRRELLDVQHVLAINRPGLREPESCQRGRLGLAPHPCSGCPPLPCPSRLARRRAS